MSIINSIITKSTEYKEQPYPFITDAPTSSLGQKDTESYLKLVSEIFEQSIVLSKDFEESINSIGDQISIGTIHNLIPVNIDTSIDSSLTNTYTKITKI